MTGSEMNKLTIATMQVEALRKQLTDAQATVEALQAQIRALTQQLDAEREKDAAQTLLAEHRRAVRVVKQEIEAVKNDQRTYRSEERCLILGSLETVLKALQRGRG